MKSPSAVGQMSNPLRNMRLGVKFALMGTAGVIITAAALVFLAVWQSGRYNNLAQGEVEALINADLDHIAQGVYHLVRTENEAVQSQVDANLKVARHVLTALGTVSLSTDTIAWMATNQFTNESISLQLPKLLVGKTWLGQNNDLSVETPIVDEVTQLVGETTTIFQRMNDRGDMLRVATTVEDRNGTRAIGTYIPAVNPDGTDNPVVSAILEDKTYHGRAYVVNAWYLTAYEPLKNSDGRLVGMLYVGVRQKAVEARVRHAILQTKVGRTGYVYVLGSSGEDRGRYIISQKGERDGENIWMSRDSDGNLVIQDIIAKATALGPLDMATVRYRWQNPEDPTPRWKIARLVYYRPWDWVIGTSVYEDELLAYHTLLSNGRLRMTRDMAMAGIVITALVGLISVLLTLKITRPIRQMTQVAEKIIDGDLNQVVDVRSHDEIGILAHTFNLMTGKLRRSMGDLKKSEEKYRLIYENAMEGLFQSSLEGRFLSVNPATARLLAYDSPETLISDITNTRRQIFNNPEDRDAMVSNLLERGEVSGFEVQGCRRDGKKIWVSVSARMRYDEKGKPAFIEGFITDITDRKQAEEALGESRNYLNEIINAVADPMFVKDQEHRWVLVNDAFCTFVGYARKELLGKSEYDFFERDEADIFRSNDERILATGKENINEELFTDARGIVHTIVTKKTLYRDKTSQKFIVGIIRDVTEQKAAEEEKKQLELRLNQAQKMEAIGTLAGGIAHDFNNILSAIIGYTELAEDDVRDPDKSRKYLREVLKAGNRARELVQQILTFSRMTGTEHSPLALRPIVRDSLRMLRSVIPSTIEIRQDLAASGLIMSDATQIHQIIMNLCTNAAHAMDETGGLLEVSLSEETIMIPTVFHDFHLIPGPYLKLTIRDTGKGIPPEIMDKIFEPYFTTKEQGRGTGLGLSVIHGIIKSHNGAITCQSALTEGTTFNVFLPMIKSESAKRVTGEKNPIPGGTERILFVDDEQILVDLARNILSSKGYKVTCRTGSLDALELFRTAPRDFDLVITDMTMPGMTGDLLALELIAIRQDIPVILCTGYNEHISEAEAKKIGIREFMLKPLNIRTITETVRKVLDARAP